MRQGSVKWVKGSKQLAVINISIIIIFLIIGLGYSYWRDSIFINTTMSTGNMDTVFSECEVIMDNNDITDVQIDESGKKLSVNIKDAHPPYSAAIKYTVENNGDIPVYCKVTSGDSSPIETEISDSNEILDPCGGTGDGTVVIRVPKEIKKNSVYTLVLKLDYVQYNEMK